MVRGKADDGTRLEVKASHQTVTCDADACDVTSADHCGDVAVAAGYDGDDDYGATDDERYRDGGVVVIQSQS